MRSKEDEMLADAQIAQFFDIPPYHVESFPIGSGVMNKNGFNCLSFASKPGAKFTSRDHAEAICANWNRDAMYKEHEKCHFCGVTLDEANYTAVKDKYGR